MSSLFQLRQSTRSFLIQCLADRELQILIYSKANYSSSKSAYHYNCTVVHSPHVWSHVRKEFLKITFNTFTNQLKPVGILQLNAISGHGWNIRRHQPFDPQLRVSHVLANQNSNNNLNNNDNLAIRNQQTIEQIRQFEETIRILKEENNQVKQLYLNALKNERFQQNANNHSNIASNSQQLNQLQHEIRTLKSVIESHKATIELLNDQNYALKFTVEELQITCTGSNLQTNNLSETNVIHSLKQELRGMKCNLESKMEKIRELENQNNNLHMRLREAEINSSSYRGILPRTMPRTSRRDEDNVSQGCCIIM